MATFSLRVEALVNGSHPTTEKRIEFYHPDLAGLAREADALAVTLGLDAAAAELRRRHDAAVALAAELEAGSAAHLDLADRAWAAWRRRNLWRLPAAGLDARHDPQGAGHRREVLKAALEQSGREGRGGDRIDTGALDSALARYVSVAGPFGPHERDGSTRALVYEPALALRRSLAGYVPS